MRCLLLAFAVALGSAATAAAGTYRVLSCGDASGDVNHAWTAENNDPAHLEQGSDCVVPSSPDEQQLETSGLFAADQLGLSSGSPPGSVAGWIVRAPSGTTIAEIAFRGYAGKRLDDDWVPGMFADGRVVPDETCAISGSASGCSIGGPDVARTEPLNAGAVSWAVSCAATSGVCGTGSSQHHVWAALYSSTVTISDPNPPSLGTPTGSLFSTPPPTFHTATDTATVSASDPVGIRQTIVYVDGQAASVVPNPCDYTFVVPCLQQPGASHSIDWRALDLADGPHRVQVAATDAAGNESRSPATTVLVDTHAPTAPVGVPRAVTRTTPAFVLGWINPAQGQGAPIARADYRLCPASSRAPCRTGSATASAIHQLAVSTPARGRWRLSVWLVDAAGNGNNANAASSVLAYLRPAGLRITRAAVRARQVLVDGVAAPRVGRVAVAVTVRLHGRLRHITRSVSLAGGRFTVAFDLPAQAVVPNGARAVAAFSGDRYHAPARATRPV